jgi:hypothetical protein
MYIVYLDTTFNLNNLYYNQNLFIYDNNKMANQIVPFFYYH